MHRFTIVLAVSFALAVGSPVAVGASGATGGTTIGTPAGAAGGSTAATAAGTTVAASANSTAELDTDTVLLRIDLQPDGTARWHVEYRVRLDGPNETQAFEEYRQDVRENPGTYRRRFGDLMRNSRRQAENRTGRSMAIRNVTVATDRRGPPRMGVVVYEFEWAAFAVGNGTAIRAGDAISEFYATEEMTLMITWPEEYRVASVTPPPDETRSGVATWEGPRQFAPDEPRLQLVRRDATPSATDTSAPGAVEGQESGVALPMPAPAAGAGILALAGLALGGWTLARRGALPAVGDSERAGDAAGDGPTTTDGNGAVVAGPPPELMSNEERVLALLEERDGRMKQAEIADELGWKAPKTSKVVQELRDAEAVTVFRLGRENVVSLPDADPRRGGGE